MIARLGLVIYWACTVIAALMIGLAIVATLFSLSSQSPAPDAGLLRFLLAGVGVAVFGVGRAALYVLAGR